ncbi:hypothetical protein GQR60_17875 [Labilibaculum sp. A4]|uniref:PLDc N-terminal domain-containing protein n=2 Tax=Labilibaculum euxinus TaxID=2686357 RepID=UPI000F61F09D|nr:hypothetical protein [Labilibaculum euxinus]
MELVTPNFGISIFMLIILVFVILLPLIALIDIVKNEFTNSNKLIWVLVVLLFPFIGTILYFIIGTKQKIK